MPKLILSPVGTSLFTNLAGDNRRLINENANALEDEISKKTKQLVIRYENQVQSLFKENNIDKLKRASAELNSLLTLYDNRFVGHQRDIHVLVTTDTYLGKKAAYNLKDYLKQYFDVVLVYTPVKLSTRTKEHFDSGIRNLLKWCDENINNYKESGYEVVFNLTGGFKSLQGYLNTIGMFYADEIVYIFEQGSELISIPRLPVSMETDLFREQAQIFLLLSQTNEGIQKSRLTSIPEIMVEEYQNDRYILSNWGELSWNNAKEEVLSQRLMALPRIAYLDSFKTDFKNTQRPRDKVVLQETIAFISCRLQESDGDISILKAGRSGGILYDNYTGRNSHLGHFRIGRGLRVSCEYKNEILELRHYGEHDYVNDNP
jgi:putative CRISPR-associated protein (TIGR02619 family)